MAVVNIFNHTTECSNTNSYTILLVCQSETFWKLPPSNSCKCWRFKTSGILRRFLWL